MISKYGLLATVLGFIVCAVAQIAALAVLVGGIGDQPAITAGTSSLIGVILATLGYIMPRLMDQEFVGPKMIESLGIGLISAFPGGAAISWYLAAFFAAMGFLALAVYHILKGR